MSRDLQHLGLAASRERLRRIVALHAGGRVLAAQRAILRTMELWRDGEPRSDDRPVEAVVTLIDITSFGSLPTFVDDRGHIIECSSDWEWGE